MVVVSNTSPIVNLAAIGQIDLLRELFGAITIPPAVYEEIAVQGAGRPGAESVESESWIVTEPVEDLRLVHTLEREVHRGEAEALVLAAERDADWLLLDERAARRIAETLNLSYVGLLGVLGRAKEKGLIDSVTPLLDALRQEAGFWISDGLYAHIQASSGEAS